MTFNPETYPYWLIERIGLALIVLAVIAVVRWFN